MMKFEWDINHLGHDFSDPTLYEALMRKCKKCNIKVYHSSESDRYNSCDAVSFINTGNLYPTLTITCDEMIIKNIIE